MRRLNTLLGYNPELRSLTAQAEKITQLQKIWGSIVPPPFNQNSHTGLVSNGQITVYTSNGAVAAKLKLLAPQLLKKLQKEGLEVTKELPKLYSALPNHCLIHPCEPRLTVWQNAHDN